MRTRTMKAFTFKRYGKTPELGFDDRDYPSVGADEILVKVHAVGLNPIDNMIPTGMFKPVLHFTLPATMGSDLAGDAAPAPDGGWILSGTRSSTTASPLSGCRAGVTLGDGGTVVFGLRVAMQKILSGRRHGASPPHMWPYAADTRVRVIADTPPMRRLTS